MPSRKPTDYLSGDFQQHSRSSFNIHSSANHLKLDRTGSPTREILYVIAREFDFSLLAKRKFSDFIGSLKFLPKRCHFLAKTEVFAQSRQTPFPQVVESGHDTTLSELMIRLRHLEDTCSWEEF